MPISVSSLKKWRDTYQMTSAAYAHGKKHEIIWFDIRMLREWNGNFNILPNYETGSNILKLTTNCDRHFLYCHCYWMVWHQNVTMGKCPTKYHRALITHKVILQGDRFLWDDYHRNGWYYKGLYTTTDGSYIETCMYRQLQPSHKL